jgi:hypothetical protein
MQKKNFIAGHRSLSLPLFNGVCCRSIGVQCNPSTADQTTITSTKISVMTDDELTSDRTIKILTPSSRVLTTNNLKRNGSHEFLLNGIENEREKKIIITSTCLDDDQMVIILCFFNLMNVNRKPITATEERNGQKASPGLKRFFSRIGSGSKYFL